MDSNSYSNLTINQPSQTTPKDEVKVKKDDKPKSFIDKYYKVFAIIALIFAVLLLIYTVYKIVPVEKAAQHGGKKKLHMNAKHISHRTHMKGGSCGCAAGASQDNLAMAYGGMFRI